MKGGEERRTRPQRDENGRGSKHNSCCFRSPKRTSTKAARREEQLEHCNTNICWSTEPSADRANWARSRQQRYSKQPASQSANRQPPSTIRHPSSAFHPSSFKSIFAQRRCICPSVRPFVRPSEYFFAHSDAFERYSESSRAKFAIHLFHTTTPIWQLTSLFPRKLLK